jgi:hypothetical protein
MTQVSARPELVQSDETPVAEVVLSDGTFVSLYKWRAIHLAYSANENPVLALATMLSMRATFDGKQKAVKEVLNLELQDWHKVTNTAMKTCN